MHPERRLGAVFVAQRNPSCSFSSHKCLLLVSFSPRLVSPPLPLPSFTFPRLSILVGAVNPNPSQGQKVRCHKPITAVRAPPAWRAPVLLWGMTLEDKVSSTRCFRLRAMQFHPHQGPRFSVVRPSPSILCSPAASINIMRRDALPKLVNGISLKQVGSNAGINAPDACSSHSPLSTRRVPRRSHLFVCLARTNLYLPAAV